MDIKTIETERLILRSFSLDDSSDLFKNWASDTITNEYLTFPPHKDEEITKRMITNWINDKVNKRWAIVLKNTNEVIGMVSACKIYNNNCIEIGYSISSKEFNNGYAFEAVSIIINHLFTECGVNVIEAIIPSKNIASIKTATKCGLTYEATLKDRYINKVTKEINDLLIYSIFKN